MKPTWKLGGRVVGDGLTDGVGQPVQVVADQVCKRCGDEYGERELLKGVCFSCRYYKHLRTGCRLELRPNWGTEADATFPEVSGYHESLGGEPISIKRGD